MQSEISESWAACPKRFAMSRVGLWCYRQDTINNWYWNNRCKLGLFQHPEACGNSSCAHLMNQNVEMCELVRKALALLGKLGFRVDGLAQRHLVNVC